MEQGFKIRVNPKTSREVQEIMFSHGWEWVTGSKKIEDTDKPYLFIYDDMFITYDENPDYFDMKELPELTIEQVREKLKSEVDMLRGEVASLMQAAVNVSSEALSESQDEVVISGERNLLAVSDFSSDMGNLRRAFDLFEQKTQILRLLDISSQAEGVRIYIGGESQVVPFEELSIVSAPYEVDGRVVGTLGVIGPTRMPYDKMIQIVDITSKLVSNALSYRK